MEKSDFQELIEDAGYEPHSYSGRGMYGQKCLAIDLSESETLGVFVSEVIQVIGLRLGLAASLRTASNSFRDMQIDSMGRGIVVYFPEILFVEE